MLFLNNDDIHRVLTIEDTLRVLEEGHRELERGELVSRSRIDTYTETSREAFFHRWGTMEGSSKGLHRHAIRMKSDIVSWRDHGGVRVEDKYCVQPGLFCGLIFLFDTENGEPLAILNEGHLQHLRVGALAGLGAKYLAKKDAATVGMLGAGGMARSHLTAFKAVLPIQRCQVYCPTPEHRLEYAREMAELLDVEVIPCDTAEEAVAGVDILSACTNAVRPLVSGDMVEPGVHLTCVASELAEEALAKIDVGIGGGPVSQLASGVRIDQSRGFPTYLAGNMEALLAANGRERRGSGEPASAGPRAERHARVVPLNDLIAGRAAGRLNDQEISSSGSVGGGERGEGKQGLQFVTVASLVYDLARQAGLGHEVPTEWFLQDVRD